MMNPEVKKLWVDRLRSLDSSRQGRLVLKNGKGQMCCLGVLCEIAVEQGIIPPPSQNRATGYYSYGDPGRADHLPYEVMQWAGLDRANPMVNYHNTLADLNDGNYTSSTNGNKRKVSFRQIAAVIQRFF